MMYTILYLNSFLIIFFSIVFCESNSISIKYIHKDCFIIFNNKLIIILIYIQNIFFNFSITCLMKKGYKAFHEFEKSDKGHHDKEKHKQEYNEEDGEEKKNHEEVGHYGEEHHGEDGEKNAKFGEEGKHQKGYSTKGEHSVFKKVRIM